VDVFVFLIFFCV